MRKNIFIFVLVLLFPVISIAQTNKQSLVPGTRVFSAPEGVGINKPAVEEAKVNEVVPGGEYITELAKINKKHRIWPAMDCFSRIEVFPPAMNGLTDLSGLVTRGETLKMSGITAAPMAVLGADVGYGTAFICPVRLEEDVKIRRITVVGSYNAGSEGSKGWATLLDVIPIGGAGGTTAYARFSWDETEESFTKRSYLSWDIYPRPNNIYPAHLKIRIYRWNGATGDFLSGDQSFSINYIDLEYYL